MSYTSTYEKYSSVLAPHEFTYEDVETAGKFLSESTFQEMGKWADDRTVTHELADRAFRMVVDMPEDGDSSKAVVVTGEFANGILPTHVARARIVRDMTDPAATLVFQPNSMLGESNLNLSYKERRKLWRGNLDPMIGRLGVTLEHLENPENLTFFGPSQGGTVALEYAARGDTPAASLGLVELPNVTERSRVKMGVDFFGCGGQLKAVVGENYDDLNSSFSKDTLETLGVVGMLKYTLGIIKPGNPAMVGILRGGTAQEHIQTVLEKGGSVVNAYGTEDSVSPLAANEQLTKALENESRYRGVVISGADHSITNHFALNGALVRLANRLRQN